MKKRNVLACALALALTLPCTALAATNPSVKRLYDSDTVVSNNVSLEASATEGTTIDVQATDEQAANVELTSTEVVVASFRINGDCTDTVLNLNLGSSYAGAKGRLFVQYLDGSFGIIEFTLDANGRVSILAGSVSLVTVVVDTATINANAGTTTTDTGSKSPFTGVDLIGVAGFSTVTLVAALGCGAAALKTKED